MGEVKTKAARAANTNGKGAKEMELTTPIVADSTDGVNGMVAIPLALTPTLARLWQRAERSGQVLVCGACGERISGLHRGRGRDVAEHEGHLYSACGHAVTWTDPRLVAAVEVRNG